MMETEDDDLVKAMQILDAQVYEQAYKLLQDTLDVETNKMLNGLRRIRIGDNEFIHGIKQK